MPPVTAGMTGKIRTLIVDDEALARAKLRQLLAAEPDVEIVGEAADGKRAMELILEESPDLLFLDVQMPELDGFGVLAGLGPDRPACVIFVTAHDKFALQAFEAHAAEYLLKPFGRERFSKALDRARTLLHPGSPTKGKTSPLAGLLAEAAHRPLAGGRIAVKSEGRILLIKMDELDWVEAADNYAVLHVGKERHVLRETMNSLEARLNPERFLRISRSTIVNVDQIRDFEPLFHGEYTVRLRSGVKLTCSRSYRDRLKQFLPT